MHLACVLSVLRPRGKPAERDPSIPPTATPSSCPSFPFPLDKVSAAAGLAAGRRPAFGLGWGHSRREIIPPRPGPGVGRTFTANILDLEVSDGVLEASKLSALQILDKAKMDFLLRKSHFQSVLWSARQVTFCEECAAQVDFSMCRVVSLVCNTRACACVANRPMPQCGWAQLSDGLSGPSHRRLSMRVCVVFPRHK